MDNKQVPKHIAVIMDGNGRWAREHNLPRVAGHAKGITRIREIVRAASEMGVKFLTLFAFSHENWNRPKKEISMLMRALDNFLRLELKEIEKNNIRLIIIGRQHPIPEYLKKRIANAEERTKGNKGFTLIVAFNYGSRQEIIDAIKKFTDSVINKKNKLEDLDESLFAKFLYTADIPDPDLLIRTSGEIRISNFLLWQLSYSELYFLNKYWPDFDKNDLYKAVLDYQKRERRFGNI
jgi:undecaprenyl diphosphate synthase